MGGADRTPSSEPWTGGSVPIEAIHEMAKAAARKWGLPPEDGEDVAQDVALKLLQGAAPPEDRGPDARRAWTEALVRNGVRDYARRERRRRVARPDAAAHPWLRHREAGRPDPLPAGPPAVVPEALPGRLRYVLALVMEGVDTAQIAAALALGGSGVRTRIGCIERLVRLPPAERGAILAGAHATRGRRGRAWITLARELRRREWPVAQVAVLLGRRSETVRSGLRRAGARS
jgi:DNA-directed RNA polymerase specialized sigma24 family protein